MKSSIYRKMIAVVVVGATASVLAEAGELAGYQLLVTSVRTGDTELFLVDPDLGDARNLTRSPLSEERYPAWSPDGTKIAFTSNRDGAYNLYVADADGNHIQQLTHEKPPTVCYMPSWSGDGKQIVFGLHGDKPLMAGVAPDGSGFRIFGEGHDPCISPDGKSIAYTAHTGKGFCVFVRDIEGKKVRQVTKHENRMGAVHPIWSPDGRKLLYSDQVGDKLEIFVADADGQNIQQLTKLGQISTSASWSPDGKWIAFRVTTDAYWRNAADMEKAYREKKADRRPVYVMHADGSAPHVIEPLHYQCAMDGSRPVWRPMPRRAATRRDTPYPAKVSDNGRYLLDQHGKPFFWLGDTAWELFHRLNREEAEEYLKDRADKKFTVIQAVVLAEFAGLTEPNRYGHLPLEKNDPTKPVAAYFRDIDWVVNKADELGLVIGMVPTWGDKWNKKWGEGPEIFTPENAAIYGEFLGKRYRDKPIVWILGGDRPIENDRHRAIIRAMAEGLKKGDGGRHLMTLHPPGGHSSAEYFHNDNWLAFNMLQTGHGYNHNNYDRIARVYALKPAKPCLDAEPSYEDHPAEFNAKNGYVNDYEVRKAAYWALFAGACGHTYGCHDIWQFLDKTRKPITEARTPWRKALQLPGAKQMHYARALLESRPVLTRIPDQSLVTSDVGKGTDHIQATRGEDGSYAFIYSASGKTFTVDLDKLSGQEVRATWYDPRNGEAKVLGVFARGGKRTFTPPSNGMGQDWVLILDDAARNYPLVSQR
jgi:Tol biopolymer transport system component